MARWLVRLVVLAVLGAAAWGGWLYFNSTETLEVRTVPVLRGPLTLTVTATGRLAPTTEVLVGCEVSGTVQELCVQHNDSVSKGAVIARIKPELFAAEYKQALSEYARAIADLKRLEVAEREAEREYRRVVSLRKTNAATEDELAVRSAGFDSAKASTAAGQAAVQSAQGHVDLAKYRLDRTVITSPIDGIVLDRRVDVGQTVIAALQSPILFVLAEDLSRMQLLADVSEADVGFICPDQPVSFTVNAYRDRTFSGQVRQVRNQPTRVGDVVTYTVVVDVTNRELLLRPGMPADLNIQIVRQESTAKVANAALRFRPPLSPDEVRARLEQIQWPDVPPPIGVEVASSRPAATQRGNVKPPPIDPAKGTVWQYVAGDWKVIPVWTTFTDNRETAIVTGPGVASDAEFAVEVRKRAARENMLQKAMLLSRPENRKL